MYSIMCYVSNFIKNEVMPDPFAFLPNNPIEVKILSILFGATIFSIISFKMCGIFYYKGGAPAIGKLLYLFFFGLNIDVFITISKLLHNVYIIWIIYFIVICLIFKGLNKCREIVFITHRKLLTT